MRRPQINDPTKQQTQERNCVLQHQQNPVHLHWHNKAHWLMYAQRVWHPLLVLMRCSIQESCVTAAMAQAITWTHVRRLLVAAPALLAQLLHKEHQVTGQLQQVQHSRITLTCLCNCKTMALIQARSFWTHSQPSLCSTTRQC